MTTATLRPNGTVSTSNYTTTGAASAHAALSDDSDSSYISATATLGDGATAFLDLTTVSLPSGAVTKNIRARCRMNVSSGGSYTFDLRSPGIPGALVSASGDSRIDVPADLSSAVTPIALTQTEVDGSYIRISTSETTQQVRELYVDLVYVPIPVATVDVVTPDPYTASNVVPIAWTNTLDADGGVQTRYEVKVYTDAQYGAGGFDPDTSTPYWESGIVVGSALTVNTGALATGDTYRAYVRVSQTVNGAAHWGDWAYDTFDVDVDTADIASITATPHDALGRIQIDVTRDGAGEAWEFIEVERSVDAGATWSPVRFATYVDCTGDADDFQVFDYEVGNDQNVLYRARATYLLSGLPITGEWMETADPTAWSSDDFWLKAPLDPTLNVIVKLTRMISPRRPRRRGVFNVIGAASPVVVSDVASASVATLDLWTRSTDPSPETVLEESVVLLHSPSEWELPANYYLAPGDIDHQRNAVDRDQGRSRWVTDVVEVTAPSDPTAGQ